MIVVVVDHQLVQHKLTSMRDKETSVASFVAFYAHSRCC